MLALDPPAFRLEMRRNRGSSGAQCLVAGDENDIGIVRYRFRVIDRGERAAECVIFDQTA